MTTETEGSGTSQVGDTAEGLLADEKKRSGDYLLRLKYLQADFDNYRKRVEKEMREMDDASARGVVAKLLGPLDELGLAARHVDAEEGEEMKEGVSMVYKNLMGVLESLGLERIDAVGKEFDPSMHEAVDKVQGDGEKDVVVEEVRPGYTFRGQVIRPSMVKVELGAKEEGKSE